MSVEFFHYTLDIFARLCRENPPLLPAEISSDMEAALDQIKNNCDLNKEELEDTMIVFGKKLWPYRKAFNEFVNLHEGELGEKFLMGGLSPKLKKRYHEYKEHGGTFRDMIVGRPAEFFSPEERAELCGSMVKMDLAVKSHARQSALSVDREKYEKRVVEFQLILDDIEKRLDTLRLMADDEQEHPELAAEIRAQVRSFEYGLCLLGSEHSYEAVCRAPEHFVGRKEEKRYLKMHR